MADDEAARRRNVRRRRILDNAEERKKKIFGSGTDPDSTIENDKPNATVLEAATPSPLPDTSLKDEEGSVNSVPHIQETRTPPTFNTPQLQNSVGLERSEHDNESDHRSPPNFRAESNFRAENGIESVPEITEHLRNINNLITSSGAGLSATQTRKVNSSDVQSATVVGALSSPIVPVILALFVCILLSVKLDYVVSNSIALPFLLWEAHHLWCNRHVIEATSRGVGGLLGLALVLCGVQQSIIKKMTQVTTVIKCVSEDFAFYILTIVIWYWMIGLPGSVQLVNDFAAPEMPNDFAAPETVRVTATNEEDIFDNIEDF